MAFERNKTAGDFETMLARHLERVNRLEGLCADFDAEAANAYLEGVLGAGARSRYESHLASCATCRHAVATLHRLAIPARPELADSAHPVVTWWESFKEALGFSGWRYGLLATAGVLIVLTGIYTIRRQSATISPEATIAMADRAGAASVPSPSNATSVLPVQSTSGGVPVRSESRQEQKAARSRIPVESQPRITPLPAMSDLSQQVAGVRPVTQAETEVKAEAGAPAVPPVTASSQLATMRDAESKKVEQPAQRQDSPRPSEPVPAQAAASESSQPLPNVGARRLAPRESPPKAAKPQATPKSSEDENFQPLLRRVRDKVFRFDRGVWIDQEYKPENRLQRTRLARGSAEYDRVLAETPSLAPFFDLGAVIVIWQGRVYEVRK